MIQEYHPKLSQFPLKKEQRKKMITDVKLFHDIIDMYMENKVGDVM